MARRPRTYVEGYSWHVTQRGVNRGLMFTTPGDYDAFLSILRFESERSGVRVHAYALMRNHVHLLATPDSEKAMSLLMQGIGRQYVPFFNKRHVRTGALWEGRYRPTLVYDERYWLTCMRYVELNPVRAGIVTDPEQYRWSSYRHHGLGDSDAVVSDHPLYLGLGSSTDARQKAWRHICGRHMSDEQLIVVRDAIRRGIFAGGLMATDVT